MSIRESDGEIGVYAEMSFSAESVRGDDASCGAVPLDL